MAADTHRYFCVEMTPGATPLPGSLFSTPGGFAEVYVESRNFHTGQAVGCATVNGGSQGSVMIYTLYWLAAIPDGFVWQSVNGSLSAAFN